MFRIIWQFLKPEIFLSACKPDFIKSSLTYLTYALVTKTAEALWQPNFCIANLQIVVINIYVKNLPVYNCV